MWVFGYGSLIWKTDFPFEKRIPGFIKGYVRRFWQGSIDHRGTPERPGRVVTLIPFDVWTEKFKNADFHPSATQNPIPLPDDLQVDPTHCNSESKQHYELDESICWGVAYKVADEHVEAVKNYLDHREKNGYDTVTTTFYPRPSESNTSTLMNDEIPGVLVYIATHENASFLGPDKLETMVEHIHHSTGPSGSNLDYLFGLAQALDIITPPTHRDHHIHLLRQKLLEKLDTDEHRHVWELVHDPSRYNLHELHELMDTYR